MERNNRLFFIFIVLGMYFFSVSFLLAGQILWPKKMVVSVSVADVRHKPEKPSKLSYEELDWHQTTQLLFGERILAVGQKGGWLQVKALEQKIFVDGTWRECDGWIQANQARAVSQYPRCNLVVTKPWTYVYAFDEKKREKKKIFSPVSLGTRLLGRKCGEDWWEVQLINKKKGFINSRSVRLISTKNKSSEQLRAGIFKTAELFLGVPYLWGGRSFHNKTFKKQWTSVDCSNLTHLCYRCFGIDIPRNTRSQYQACRKIKKKPMAGDLIFISSKNDPSAIYHVLLYGGSDRLVDAKSTLFGKKIKKVIKSIGEKRFGKHVERL
ncbi:C40 family peptidase, partial [Candidatus Babeliales bacterium]|nr:C40 family peptidase [Candidatus Babeliales bacterium]